MKSASERLLDNLRRAGPGGVDLAALAARVGLEPDPARELLETMQERGDAVLWGRRWYVVEGSRWRVGTLARRGRGSVVRCAPMSAPAGRSRTRREQAVELFVSDRDRGGARNGDLVLIKPLRSPRARRDAARLPEAAVVKVLRRARQTLVGRLERAHPRAAWSVVSFDSGDAADARDLMVRVGAGSEPLEAGTWVVLELGEARRDGALQAEVKEVLGTLDQGGTDLKVVMRQYGIEEAWPEEAVAQAESLPDQPSTAELSGRRDLRQDLTVTIDGESARDFDDAIAVEQQARGFRARIHIADVAHYVRDDSAIDRVAQQRGTSVYFPERAVHMLPSQLSETLCSLRPGVPRLALTVEMRFDLQGVRQSVELYESAITSRHRLTYRQVEDLYEAAPEPDGARGRKPRPQGGLPGQTVGMLMAARRLARLLLQRREERGALDFLLPEVELQIDEQGSIVRVGPAERLESHRVIEELMVAANEAVAEELCRRLEGVRSPVVLYRDHPPPQAEDLAGVATVCEVLGIEPPVLGEDGVLLRGELPRVLAEARARGAGPVLDQLSLRAMSRAVYSPTCGGHFALGAPYYCHFTSPIRRYPDLVDHRRVKELLTGASSPGGGTRAARLASWLSDRERNAEAAERELRRWKKLRFLEDRVGGLYAGTITGVEEFGVFVMLAELGVDGLVPTDTLPGKRWEHDERGMRLVEAGGQRTLRLGDTIEVEIAAVDTVRRRIDLTLASSSQAPAGPRQANWPEGGRRSRSAGQEPGNGSGRRRAPFRRTPARPRRGRRG